MPSKLITCLRCHQVASRDAHSRSQICLPCIPGHVMDAARAIAAVRNAIARGLLEPVDGKPCTDCGAPATQYDHRDYLLLLDVQPVCRSCNQKRGVAFDSRYRPEREKA